MAKADLEQLLTDYYRLIEVLDNPQGISPYDIIGCVDNVLSRALCFKQNQLLPNIKAHLKCYAEKYRDVRPYNIPYHLFKIVSSHKNVFLKEEIESYLKRCEDTFDELCEVELANQSSISSHVFEVGRTLADHYCKANLPENINNIFARILECMDYKISFMPAFRSTILLHELAVMARKLKSSTYENAFNKLLQVVSPNIKNEMQHQRVDFRIPKDNIDEIFDNIFCTEDPGFNLFMMSISFIPDVDQIEMISKHLPKNDDLLKHFTRIYFNSNGNIASISSSYKNENKEYDIEGYRQITELSSMILHYVIEKGVTTGRITENDILDYLSTSPVVNVKRLIIIQRGVSAFFLKDYITSISILLPQIEYMIGAMYRILGHSITNCNQNGVQVDGLGEILKKGRITLLGKNVSYYLQSTLTHQSGWNLRNLFSHGQSTDFNFINAERILQIMLLIAGIRYVKVPVSAD